MEGLQGLEGWRWLLIIEVCNRRGFFPLVAALNSLGLQGVFACALSMITWMILPDFPGTTRWLRPEQKELAAQRLLSDNLGSTGDQENQPCVSVLMSPPVMLICNAPLVPTKRLSLIASPTGESGIFQSCTCWQLV